MSYITCLRRRALLPFPKHLKSGRAPRLDEITAGIIKLSDAVSVKWLKSLHNTIFSSHFTIRASTASIMHGIIQFSIPSKVFTQAILNRLKLKAEVLASMRLSQWTRMC